MEKKVRNDSELDKFQLSVLCFIDRTRNEKTYNKINIY